MTSKVGRMIQSVWRLIKMKYLPTLVIVNTKKCVVAWSKHIRNVPSYNWSKPWILKDVIISPNPWQHFMSWSKPQRRIVFREAVIPWRLSPLDPNHNDPSHNWSKPWILKDVIISSHPDNFHPLGLYRCQLILGQLNIKLFNVLYPCQLIIGQLNRKNINWLFVQWYALFSSLLFNWHIYQLTFVPV